MESTLNKPLVGNLVYSLLGKRSSGGWSGKPADWADIRTDCPENSIALYAGESGTRDYTFNGKSQVGYEVIGSPTINNGIVSGFSADNILSIANSFPTEYSNFEQVVTFTTPNDLTQSFVIERLLMPGTRGGIDLLYSSSRLQLHTYFRTTDAPSVDKAITIYNSSLSANTTYTGKFMWNGTTYTLELWSNGTKLGFGTLDNSNPLYITSPFIIGGTQGSADRYFHGSIDLNNTYIKINDEYWFNGAAKLTGASEDLYLESSGTQYIDTGLSPQQSSSFELKAAKLGAFVDNNMFGSRKSSGATTDLLGIITEERQTGNRIMLCNAGMAHDTCFILYDNNYHTYIANDSGVSIDGTSYSHTADSYATNDLSIYLFGLNNRGTTQLSAQGVKILKMYDNNGVLVRHFVPVPAGFIAGCVYCPTNGMFDIVEQKFYPNKGTGNFTYGRDGSALSYNNLGFTATCTNGYKVYIDGNYYGTYASAAQCNIIWSQSGINTGDDITTPSALKAHKIWIEPATSGNNITAFHCARVAASGTEQQGVLWAHFNISNQINLGELFRGTNQIRQYLVKAVTAKDNKILVSSIIYAFGRCQSLTYLPLLVGDASLNYNFAEVFYNCYALEKISLKNFNIISAPNAFTQCLELKTIKISNVNISPTGALYSLYFRCRKLKDILPANYTNVTNMSEYITEAAELNDTVLDVRAATNLAKITCYGTSTYFMTGFKGLRVSNQAPFNNATSPQLDVSYTGMDRNALVQLFNDLPTVTGGQIINVTGCTGTADLTADDKDIALNKGWSLTLS